MTNYALIIGAGDVPGLAPLPAARSDAQAIAERVQDLQYSYIPVFPQQAIVTLYDADAHAAAIRGALMAWDTAQVDMALCSFAGYVSLSAATEPFLLLPGETAETVSELAVDDLFRDLSKTNPRFTLAWFDLCAVVPEQAEHIAMAVTSAARRHNVLALAACARTIAERDTLERPMGRLTKTLLHGLRNDDLVTLYEGDLTFARLAQYVAGIWSQQAGDAPFIRATPGGDDVILRTRWTPPHQDMMVHVYNNRPKPHCTFCGARYSFDNIYLCSVCGALYCIRCIHQRESVQPKGHRCDCGGLIL
ncbi:MAG: caspase family protein [Chloroflexi bacterium]|nr:caspase family protein [Chloroflexota bacterium]